MKKLTEQEITENLSKFYGFIDTYISKERATKLKEFYKTIELTLATSPASSVSYAHNCFAGGYVEHVNRVVEAALIYAKVWDRFGNVRDFTEEQLVFSAINHDLGKLGDSDDQPYYLPNDNQWEVDKRSKIFKFNSNIPHLRVSERSLFTLQKAGIQIDYTEYLAIKLHDGLYEKSNEDYFMQYNPEFQLKSNLPYILHQADLMASKVETIVNK